MQKSLIYKQLRKEFEHVFFLNCALRCSEVTNILEIAVWKGKTQGPSRCDRRLHNECTSFLCPSLKNAQPWALLVLLRPSACILTYKSGHP